MFFSQSAAQNKDPKYVSSAKVIDGILVLSLPDAVTPVVWQMELGQSKSSALEIRDGENGLFILTLKTPRQDVLEIATYNDRDLAIRALLVVASAVETAQGQMKKTGVTGTYLVPARTTEAANNQPFPLKRAVSFLFKSLGIIILLGIAFIMVSALVRVVSEPSGDTPSLTGSANAPVSADEFFKNR